MEFLLPERKRVCTLSKSKKMLNMSEIENDILRMTEMTS